MECQKHGETKFLTRKDGGFRCGRCSTEAVQRRRNKIKLMAIEYKGGKCQRCSYGKCPAAMQFHHLDPTKKDFGIAAGGYTRAWDKVKAELDKCILVCGNCHAEIHEELDAQSVNE